MLISGRKTAGILVEKPGSGVVVGIGVNVSISESQWPTIMAYPATSIASELAGPVDRTELAGNLLCKLDERLEQCLHVGAEKLFEDWQGYFRHRAGDHVLATTRTGKVAGELVRVDPLMGAVIRTAGDYAERIDSQELISLTDG